jgi:hypothetical protein
MSIKEKRRIVSDHCYNIGDCDKCVLNDSSKNWKNTLSTIDCLDINESDEEDLDKAIDLVLNSSTDEDIIRRIAELKKSKDLDKAHDTDKLKEALSDSVNSPSHYTDGKIEVIDYIEDKKLGFCLGNAIKYISRAGKKDKDKEAEDINKAIWYLNRYLKQLEEA